MNLAIFLPTWIGDATMATPVLRAMRTHYGPHARILGVGRPYLNELLAGTSWLDEFVPLDTKARDPKLHTGAVLRKLRGERLDVALLLRNSFREAALAWMSGAQRRVGYRMYWRGPLLTDALAPLGRNPRTEPYRMVDAYAQLAEHLGCPPVNRRLELATTLEEDHLADQAFHRLGLASGSRVIALNSSGAYGAAKLWPTPHFAQLARRIARELDYDVLVICGPNERERALEIAQLAEHPRVHSLAGFPLSLGLSKAVLRRVRMLVTTDSGPRSMAVAFDTPQVALFGPSWTTWSENPHAREERLQLPLDCGPCQRPTCPLKHHNCMTRLSVSQVLSAMVALLQRTEPQRQVA